MNATRICFIDPVHFKTIVLGILRIAYRNSICFLSAIKRRQVTATSGRNYWSQCRDLSLLALTHNIMILFVIPSIFFRALLTSAPCPFRKPGHDSMLFLFQPFTSSHALFGVPPTRRLLPSPSDVRQPASVGSVAATTPREFRSQRWS